MKRPTAFNDIDSYIAAQEGVAARALERLRRTIHKAVPDAIEIISYRMPAFRYRGILVWFAAFRGHYSLFVRPLYLQPFLKELRSYTMTKSAIHFPYGKPLPAGIVTRIAQHIARQQDAAVQVGQPAGKKRKRKVRRSA